MKVFVVFADDYDYKMIIDVYAKEEDAGERAVKENFGNVEQKAIVIECEVL
jgi:hypothetical protein